MSITPTPDSEAKAEMPRVAADTRFLTQAEFDVVRERTRQVIEEGWTAEHDDTHVTGDLARAASCYAYEGSRTDHQRELDRDDAPPMWPWDEAWWKPTDRRRDLVKAGALIVAEIERIDRAAGQSHSPSDFQAEMKRRPEVAP